MERLFGGAKVTGVSFDNDTLVGCMLHDAIYTNKDSQNATQDKQEKSNVSQEPEEVPGIVWGPTIKHYETHPRKEHVSKPSIEKQVVAPLISEEIADANTTPTQKESFKPHKAPHIVREPQTVITNVKELHQAYVRKLHPENKEKWVLYNIILEELLYELNIDPFYLLTTPKPLHSGMHEEIMETFNEIMKEEHTITQESLTEAQSHEDSCNLSSIRDCIEEMGLKLAPKDEV